MKKLLSILLFTALLTGNVLASNGGGQLTNIGPFWDGTNDAIYEGIRVYHYATGTTNNKNCYLDEIRTTGNECRSPEKDDAGTCDAVANDGIVGPMYCDGEYDIVVCTSTDADCPITPLYTFTNVRYTKDTATLWEGNYSTSTPACAASSADGTNHGQMFATIDGSDNLTSLDICSNAQWVNLFGTSVNASGYTNFSDAVTAAANKTLYINSAITLNQTQTIPSTVAVLIDKGGSLVDDSGYTLIINGPVHAGPYQIFSGFATGEVTGLSFAYPEWWGNNTTPGTTEMADELNAMLASFDGGGTGELTKGIYLVNSADLTMLANTTLKINQGSELKLDSKRLNAIDVDDISILGDGTGSKIYAINLSSGDSFPATWPIYGAVNFGSTTGVAATASDGFVFDGIELYSDWTGTPDGSGRNDKTEGLIVVNANNVKITNNDIHHWISECININQGVAAPTGGENFGILIADNFIHDFDHDGISIQSQVIYNIIVRDNTLKNGFNGIETVIGQVRGNTIDTMLGSGITTGGTGSWFNFTAQGNTLRTITSVGVDATFADAGGGTVPANSGPVKVIGNTVESSTGNGINVKNCADVTVTDNVVESTGAASYGFTNLKSGYISDNYASGNGAGTVGMSIGASMVDVEFGTNHMNESITTPYSGLDNATGIRPAKMPIRASVDTSSHTGDTAETTLRTFTLPANFLANQSGIHIMASGANTGGSGIKTLRLKFGSSTIGAIVTSASPAASWRFDAWIINSAGANTQRYAIIGYDSTGIDVNVSGGTSETISGTIAVTLTGELAAGADVVAVDMWVVEPIQGIRGID